MLYVGHFHAYLCTKLLAYKHLDCRKLPDKFGSNGALEYAEPRFHVCHDLIFHSQTLSSQDQSPIILLRLQPDDLTLQRVRRPIWKCLSLS